MTVDGLTANDKVYDGGTDATLTGTAALDGVVGSDDVSIAGTAAATFASADVADDISVSVSGLQLDGTKASNYEVTLPTLSADIIPAEIIVVPTSGQSKTEGEDDPVLAYLAEGWKLDHGNSLLTGALSREAGETVGDYAILQGTLGVTNANYYIIFTGSVLFRINAYVGFPTVNASTLKVYPNPVKSGQDVSIASDVTDSLIRIYSLTGTLVKQQSVTGSVTTVNVTLPSGVYILSLGAERVKLEVR